MSGTVSDEPVYFPPWQRHQPLHYSDDADAQRWIERIVNNFTRALTPDDIFDLIAEEMPASEDRQFNVLILVH